MITLIDYKAGNLTSVRKAFTFLGRSRWSPKTRSVVRDAEALVLPGVGHFCTTERLATSGVRDAVLEAIGRGTPFLGICVGMQWQFAGSTEAPETQGLGLFEGPCERFQTDAQSSARGMEPDSPHTQRRALAPTPRMCQMTALCTSRIPIARRLWRVCRAVTSYGETFAASVERENVFGVQFHPEKSGDTGLRILKNFLQLRCGKERAMSTGITKRIIACLDVTKGRVVKGVQFVDLIDAGDPAELAHLHAASGADEIVLLDITATSDARPILIDVVRRTARQLFVPFTVGGGVRSLDDASALFDAGADKISINSAGNQDS